jgi:hypothetical protein
LVWAVIAVRCWLGIQADYEKAGVHLTIIILIILALITIVALCCHEEMRERER